MYSIKLFIASILIFAYEINCKPEIDNNSSNRSNEIPDYYWREYTGVIPGDAIPGGIDASGRPTYIGQMIHPHSWLLPATIRSGSISALASAGGSSFTAEKFVKILCSRNLSKYKWIRTKYEETRLLTTYCHLVLGGTEAGFALNIGRVHHELETTIGKVFAYDTPHKGLIIPNGKKELSYQTYEILTYDCNFNACTFANEPHCF